MRQSFLFITHSYLYRKRVFCSLGSRQPLLTFAKICIPMRLLATGFIFLIVVMMGCSPNSVTINNDLKKYFDENKVEGCFGMMDNGTGQFTIYNLSRYRDSSYLPASTFKIVNSLIGLQTGA